MAFAGDKMQLLRRGIIGRIAHIQYKTKCDVSLVNGTNGEFTLVATWPGGTHKIHFSRRRGLGVTASKVPLQQRFAKSVCGFSEDIVRELKRARGI